MRIVFPARGGATIEPALSLADRRDQIDDAHAQIFARRLETQAYIGIARTKIVEGDALARGVGIGAVDRLDLEQREISLAFLRRPHLARDRVARAQIEPLDLRWRDVDVVGPVQIVPVLAAQKAVAFRQDLEHAFAAQHRIRIEKILLDAKDEILLSKP